MEQLLLAGRQLVREALGEVADLQRVEQLLGAVLRALAAAPCGVDEDEVVEQRQVAVCGRRADESGDRCAGRLGRARRRRGRRRSRRPPRAPSCPPGSAAASSCRCRSHRAGRRSGPAPTDRSTGRSRTLPSIALPTLGGHQDRGIDLGARRTFGAPTGHRDSLRRGSSWHPTLSSGTGGTVVGGGMAATASRWAGPSNGLVRQRSGTRVPLTTSCRDRRVRPGRHPDGVRVQHWPDERPGQCPAVRHERSCRGAVRRCRPVGRHRRRPVHVPDLPRRGQPDGRPRQRAR